jgi:hypothetical protein
MIATVKEKNDGGYLVTYDDHPRTLHVPPDPQNRHYIAVQEWIAEGNTPDAPPSQQPDIDRRNARAALIADIASANPVDLRDKINGICAYLRGD